MTDTVTIDNYDIKAHERYAVDREAHDVTFLADAKDIPRHFNLAHTATSLSTKWEELFETHDLRHPFAAFAPPPGYASMRNRFFSQAISPEFDWADEDEEDEEQKERRERQRAQEYRNRILSKKAKQIPLALFEKDRTALLNLLESVQMLNGFLREVHARKLQYQKG